MMHIIGPAFVVLHALALFAYTLRWLWIAILAVALLINAVTAARAEELIDPTPEEYAALQKWIPATCCWTGNCCKKVSESALILLPENQVKVLSTGQVLSRTGWSQDGQTWRCTCDFVPALQIWRSHPYAKTHCVFPVPHGS